MPWAEIYASLDCCRLSSAVWGGKELGLFLEKKAEHRDHASPSQIQLTSTDRPHTGALLGAELACACALVRSLH